MTRLGLIARADCSGLANQTHEVWRHLHPERTLIVDLKDRNRGPFRPEKFDSDILVTEFDRPTDEEIRWLVDGSDVIYCAETPTHPGLNFYCAETGTRLVIHANPELWDPTYAPFAEVWTATAWREDLLPPHTIVPFPVATDRFRARSSDALKGVKRVLHVGAPAMLDRNGTDLVARALKHVRYPIELVLRGGVENYWDLFADVDALILPRRYAGLCLTMQEAAASGLPIVMLDSDVNACRTIPELRVPTHSAEAHPMKGGMVEVFDARPEDVAACIDRLTDSDVVWDACLASYTWAQSISWEAQLPKWQALLEDS